jgi:DNA-binding SARP family transcriptional activator
MTPERGQMPRLALLGTFTLALGRDTVPLPPYARRLLAFLALQQRGTARPAVAGSLWPDAAPRRADGNLRTLLWRTAHLIRPPLVAADHESLRLDPAVLVDVDAVERQAADVDLLGEVPVAVLCQDLLPDWPDEWLHGARERFRQFRLRTLDRLCAHHQRHGRIDVAMEAALAGVTNEPLREAAHRQLVEIHLSEGNYAEALREYELYRLLLRDELGIPPSPRFRRLVHPLLGRPLDGEGDAQLTVG